MSGCPHDIPAKSVSKGANNDTPLQTMFRRDI